MDDLDLERIADRVEAYHLAYRQTDHDTLARLTAIYLAAAESAGLSQTLAAVRPAIDRLTHSEGMAVSLAMYNADQAVRFLLDDKGGNNGTS